jgi:cysteine synthase
MRSINEAVGETAVLRLHKLEEVLGVQTEIWMKLESLNPLSSVKDRVARGMIDKAIADGRLTPGSGQMLVESSSGNLAIALSQQCALHGFQMVCVVDPSALGKVQAAEIFGAQLDVIKVDPSWPTSQVKVARRERVAQICAENPTAVHLDQYGSGDNEQTHFETTGPEIFAQVGGELDIMVGSVSTGGTLTGSGAFLKERMPDLRLVGVEPVGSTIFTKEDSDVPYLNAGSGLDMPCARVERAVASGMVSESYQIPDNAALTACVLIARTDAVLVGLSTGQALCGVLRTLQAHPEAKKVLFVNCDAGRVYAPYVLKHQQDHFPEATAKDIHQALLESLTPKVELALRQAGA